MDVKASTEALRYVLRRGGHLYLWTKDFGAAWTTDEVATDEPHGIEFDLASDDVIQIHIGRDVDPTNTLRLDLHRRPLHGLKIHSDDVVWGARGGMEGGG